MALKNRTPLNTNMVFLSIVSRDENDEKIKPFFRISRVIDSKIEKTDETYEVLSGNLYKVNFKDKVFRNQTTPTVDLIFKDNTQGSDETYCLNLTYRNSTRSLFNSLAGLEDFDDLEVSVYNNKKGYETFSLRQNGEKTNWKYELDELPVIKKVTINRKEESDFSEINTFFENELKEIQKFLAEKYQYTASEHKVVEQEEHKEKPVTTENAVPATKNNGKSEEKAAAAPTPVAPPASTQRTVNRTVTRSKPTATATHTEPPAQKVSEDDIPF